MTNDEWAVCECSSFVLGRSREDAYLNGVVWLSTEVTSYDAVDRCEKSKVSTPGHFFRRGADGLWHRSDAGHAGGRRPRVRAATGRDSGPVSWSFLHRSGTVGHRSAGGGVQRDARACGHALQVGRTAVVDRPDIRAWHRCHASTPGGGRAPVNRDADAADLGRPTVYAAAPVVDRPNNEDRDFLARALF